MIEVLYIKNDAHLSTRDLASIEALLDAQAVAKAHRYRRWQDKQAFLLGKLLLAVHLVKHSYKSTLLKNLQYTSFNRPFIKEKSIDFNISHSGEYVVCAFSTDQKVGIDIEELQHIDLQSLFYVLSKREKEEIGNAPDQPNAFFRIWSAKEAILKADGCGLVDNLHELEIYADTGLFKNQMYHLKPLAIHPKYSSILASSSRIEKMIIAEVTMDDCRVYMPVN